MNHIYRVVYNSATNTYQAVPENSTGKHKTASEKSSCAVSDVSEKGAFFSLKPMALCAMAMGLSSTGAWAAPTGGHISAGDASISQHGKITNIQQNSQKAAINWQTFGIKADETVNFKQPNAQAVILNRVIGNEKSVIDGAMNANGKVFISNPNGMIIGKNAQINVGALLATTAKIKDQDFMNGFFKFDEATGDITHLGDIKVPTGGVVALIAPIVANKGNITAPQGKVLLASAEQFSITLPDNGQFAYTLDRGTLQGLVDNGGAILADGGHVILTAKGTDAVKKSLIKHTGKIEANTVQNKNGVIELLGDLDNTRLEASGSLKAEAEQGDGGFVETSAAKLGINDLQVSTQSKYGKTGTWLIDPKDFTVAPSGGDMTGKKVEEGLQANNVVLKSRDGAKEGKGDVIINDEISWDKNTLTLDAESDIHINKTLNGTGTAKLAFEYGQGTADGGQSDYHITNGSKVNLPVGKTFTTQKGSNGEKVAFDVIHQMPKIASNSSLFESENIAFGIDLDLSDTKNYQGFIGWQVNNNVRIHGLGHTVNNLQIATKLDNLDNPVGFISDLSNGEIRDLGINNYNISATGNRYGYVGGLVGRIKSSKIKNSYTIGNMNIDSNAVYEKVFVGGLVGSSNDTSFENVYSKGTLQAQSTSSDTNFGGLIGASHSNKIRKSHSEVNVHTNTNAGGLIGYSSYDNIIDAHAIGNVAANAGVGGLIGVTSGSNIENSYATGNINASTSSSIGGLIGSMIVGNINDSYATGKVIGGSEIVPNTIYGSVGGLIGTVSTSLSTGSGTINGGTITNSYATGDVSSNAEETRVGGLIGEGGDISDSYSTSNVSTSGKGGIAGGLVGMNGTIKNSYATGNVLTTGFMAYAGGLVGATSINSEIQSSYATGNVATAGDQSHAGGILGLGENIKNSYSSGSISTSGLFAHAGGLIGSGSNIHNSYTDTNSVTTAGQNSYAGGIVGYYWDNNANHGSSNTFFSTDKLTNFSAIGQVVNMGQPAFTNVTGKRGQELRQKSTFQDWDFEKTWRIDEGNDYPRLRALTEGTITISPTTPSNPTNQNSANVKAVELHKDYNGIAVQTIDDLKKLRGWTGYGGRLDGIVVQGLKNGDKPEDVFTGSVNFDGAKSNWKGAINAGEYILDPSGLGSQKYEIIWKTGSLNIHPAKVYLTGRKLADGTATIDANHVVTIQGLKDRDLVVKDGVIVQSGTGTLTGSQLNLNQAYALKDAGTLKLGGERAGNYVLGDLDKHKFMIVNQKYLDDLKKDNGGTSVPPPKPPVTPTVPTNPTQPVNPTTTTPAQPTQPNNPVVPITPTVSTNPTQPVNPTTTAPVQPTQPSNPVVPNTPTVPINPTYSRLMELKHPISQEQREIQTRIDEEKPKIYAIDTEKLEITPVSDKDKELLKKLEKFIFENNYLEISNTLVEFSKETVEALPYLLSKSSFAQLQIINSRLSQDLVRINNGVLENADEIDDLLTRSDNLMGGGSWGQASKLGKAVKGFDAIMKVKTLADTARKILATEQAYRDGVSKGHNIDLITNSTDYLGWKVPVVGAGMAVWKSAIAINELIAGDTLAGALDRQLTDAKTTMDNFSLSMDIIARQLAEGKITKKQALEQYNKFSSNALEQLGSINDLLLITDDTPILDKIGKITVIAAIGLTSNTANLERVSNAVSDGMGAISQYRFKHILQKAELQRIANGNLSEIQ